MDNDKLLFEEIDKSFNYIFTFRLLWLVSTITLLFTMLAIEYPSAFKTLGSITCATATLSIVFLIKNRLSISKIGKMQTASNIGKK